MFKENQYIVYPLQGVGKIEKTQKRVSKDKLYYVIYFVHSEMTIMVPVDKAEELGIRPIISKNSAIKALKTLSEDDIIIPDWKLRYQTNIDLLKTGEMLDNVKVVRTLYRRSLRLDLPILERKLYDTAVTILRDELVISLELSKKEIDKMILYNLNSKED
jgi:CarD family transcriptional regulator